MNNDFEEPLKNLPARTQESIADYTALAKLADEFLSRRMLSKERFTGAHRGRARLWLYEKCFDRDGGILKL